jgi:hypothetical protein
MDWANRVLHVKLSSTLHICATRLTDVVTPVGKHPSWGLRPGTPSGLNYLLLWIQESVCRPQRAGKL